MMASPITPRPPQTYPELVNQISLDKLKSQNICPDETLNTQPLLEELTAVDRLLVTKRLRIRSTLLMQGKKNKFFVRTQDRNLIYTIEEQNRWWLGYLCYGLRPLQLKVINSQGTEVMTINRPYACTSRVLPCQLQTLQICSPPGHVIGSVQQQWSSVKPMYLVLNNSNDPIFWVRGPCITVSLFRDVQFEIQRADGNYGGTIYKRWQGLGHALFMSSITDRFGLEFESDLSVREKALLLAVSLLLDYMYYDS